jgi:hypothetical protein
VKHHPLTLTALAFVLAGLMACGSSSSSDDVDIDIDPGDQTGNGDTDNQNGANDNDDNDDTDTATEETYRFTIDHTVSGAVGRMGEHSLLITADEDEDPRVGHDGEYPLNYRAFVSFDIEGLDNALMGVEVESAHLRVWVPQVINSPVDNLGELYAWLTDYGDTLEESDFDGEAGLYNTSGGFSSGTGTGWRDIEVTGIIRSVVDNREQIGDRVQFQLRHSFEPGSAIDVHLTMLCLKEDCGEEGGPAELVIETRDPF